MNMRLTEQTPRFSRRLVVMLIAAAIALGVAGTTGVESADAALRWTSPGPSGYDNGVLYVGARLDGIPWGWSWERTCATTRGINNRPPDVCLRDSSFGFGVGMNGYWKIPLPNGPDAQGLHWSQIEKRAAQPGRIRIDATLYGIPWGQSWEQTCSGTPGLEERAPDLCYNDFWNQRGGWWLPIANG
jgi:hypothetical protein